MSLHSRPHPFIRIPDIVWIRSCRSGMTQNVFPGSKAMSRYRHAVVVLFPKFERYCASANMLYIFIIIQSIGTTEQKLDTSALLGADCQGKIGSSSSAA